MLRMVRLRGLRACVELRQREGESSIVGDGGNSVQPWRDSCRSRQEQHKLTQRGAGKAMFERRYTSTLRSQSFFLGLCVDFIGKKKKQKSIYV